MHKGRLNGVDQIFDVQTCSTCISIGCHDNSLGTLNFRLVDAHFGISSKAEKNRGWRRALSRIIYLEKSQKKQ